MTPTQQRNYDRIAAQGYKAIKHITVRPSPIHRMLFNFALYRLVIMAQECRFARSPNRS